MGEPGSDKLFTDNASGLCVRWVLHDVECDL